MMKSDANNILGERGIEGVRKSFDGAPPPEPEPPEPEPEPEPPEPEPEPEPEPGGGHPTRFTVTHFEDIKLNTSPSYVVKGIIPRDGLAIVWGSPKCGKSFWTYDLMMHVALGYPYRGHRVRQGTVVYCALEGIGYFSNRIEAWRRRNLNGRTEPVPFHLITTSFGLIADHDELIATIKAQIADTPSAVVIDTLNRALDGDENKSEDMRKFICAADAIYAGFGCVVVIIHHCGIAGTRPRGHTSLDGANACQIAVAKDEEGRITATVEYMKDGQSGAVISSKLDVVKLGQDDDGDDITSCVIVEADPPDPADNLTGNNALVYRALRELSDEAGIAAKPGQAVPSGAKLVLQLAWRNRFYDLHSGGQAGHQEKSIQQGASRSGKAQINWVLARVRLHPGQAGQGKKLKCPGTNR